MSETPLAPTGVREPPPHFRLPLAGPEQSVSDRFHDTGAYWIWSDERQPEQSRILLHEWRPEGIVTYDRTGDFVHWIPAGMLHGVPELFTYWISSDADCVWMQFERTDRTTYLLVAGGASGVNLRRQLQWRCQRCGFVMAEQEITLEEPTFRRFLAAERDALEAFSSATESHRCPACGEQHGVGHGLSSGMSIDNIPTPAPRATGLTEPEVVRLCRVDELMDGDRRIVATAHGSEIVLFRCGGRYVAVENRCPHKGGPLGLGKIQKDVLVCPWHHFRFDLQSGCSVTNPSMAATVFAPFVEDGAVWIRVLPVNPDG